MLSLSVYKYIKVSVNFSENIFCYIDQPQLLVLLKQDAKEVISSVELLASHGLLNLPPTINLLGNLGS